ncbi:cyclic peptide export ABC transporter [uncultured Aquimarina sp.]|uniref:cyclic peptide export ABC transporter n=1 Tax=uncultured Aquimarina sp. TaxID=575652 RepID=UPI00263976F1|nr:cyclic peptide export ABC transporter [uncultured Aquimarina sp.]
MKKEILEISKSKLVPIKSMVGYSILAIISGLSGFAFIATINKVISLSIKSGLHEIKDFLWMFIATIIVFFVTRRWLSGGIINLSQNIYWGIRKDVIRLILKAPYRKLQEYKNEVYSTLTSDVGNITSASLLIITFFSSIILIISCLGYMAYLSLSLFTVSLGVIVVGVLVYTIRSRKGDKQFQEVRELERNFMGVFSSILDGAKEININPDKGVDIYENRLIDIINSGKRTNVKAYLRYLNSELVSQLLFYGLITFILVYAGEMLNVSIDIVISFVFVLLYLLGPIVNVMTIIPFMSNAAISFKKMNTLKTELENHQEESEQKGENKSKYYDFNSLEIKNYSFSYGEDKFSVGPIDLKINRNEVIFIYGGNGAGKTTFINTILKLYDLDNGSALMDDIPIQSEKMDDVKRMFSPVFSDFYLFDEFYGIPKVDLDKATYYLNLFELDDKVTIENNKFSTTNLSTGQRKRLALISVLLEDRPILVLDEWAADQDPHFRRKFYKEILPIIVSKEDKTIIAITHDDQYYHVADKLLKMEYGRLIEESKEMLETIF